MIVYYLVFFRIWGERLVRLKFVVVKCGVVVVIVVVVEVIVCFLMMSVKVVCSCVMLL